MTQHNSFIYGRPVSGSEFINRQAELSSIMQRLANRESTAIVGEPHSGKTSLLYRIGEKPVFEQYLDTATRNYQFVYLDLLPADSNYSGQAFWEEIFGVLRSRIRSKSVHEQIQQCKDANYSTRAIMNLSEYFEKNSIFVVLLLDEVERLLVHPNFNDHSFFAALRSLASAKNSPITFVTASRMALEDMNKLAKERIAIGSPLFNISIQIKLKPFREDYVLATMDKAGNALSIEDRQFIYRVSGGNPFLLQAMCATLLEFPESGTKRYEYAAEEFYARVSFHFDDLWDHMNDITRTTAVMLALMELGGRAFGKRFAYGELERTDIFGRELANLQSSGLALKVDDKFRFKFDREHMMLWRGEMWSASSQAFVWWVRDTVIAETRKVKSYSDWLQAKRYRFLVTEQQWETIIREMGKLPDWAVRGVGGLARSLLIEITGGNFG